ncbi:helix-turn-helix domain-containing protein [Kocuria palustris]|uniref:helix-turn-helix domain-containing protein n=1 Tax=Kocuria palustris TaxID=71999 RepID=UPI00331FDD36
MDADQKEWAARVGDEVRAWLARSRHSQAQLAEHLGVAKSAITRRVRGEYPFAITELIEISRWLDISLGELLGPEILQARESPRSDLVTTGAGELPRLDSNQQPFD